MATITDKQEQKSSGRKFSLTERIAFYEDLASFSKEGIPPFRAISEMNSIAQLRKLKTGGTLRTAIRGLQEGRSLSESLAGLIPPVEQVMIASGEDSGRLAQSLLSLSSMLERIQKVKGAMKKTAFKIFMMSSVLFGVMGFVIKTVAPTASALLPEKMKATMIFAPYYFDIGNALIDYGWLLGVALAAYIISIAIMLPMATGSFRKWLDNKHLPFSLYRMLNSSFFLVSLSSMMEAGMPVRDALASFEKSSKGWSKWHFKKMIRSVKLGKPEVEAIDTGFLPQDVADRLRIYSMLPSVSQIMNKLGDFSLIRFERKIESTGKVFDTAMMIITAIFILSTIFALGETSFTISDAANANQM